MTNLQEKFLESIFVKTGGRPENPSIAKMCAEIVENDPNNYVLVRWPESQLLMDEKWFDSECFLADMKNDTIGNSAYFVPATRIEFLQKAIKDIDVKYKK